MSAESMIETMRMMATFKRTKKGVRLLDDRGDLIVEWRDGCPNQPTDKESAISQAAALIGGRQ